MSTHWYVLSIKPHKERSVSQLLQTREIEVYFPTIRVEPKNPRAAKIRPYFPGYIFVRIDLQEQGDDALRWIPGTRGIVRFGAQPAIVPDPLIQEIKRRIDHIETVKKQWPHDLRKGDPVRIIAGPLKGYEAIFHAHLSGSQRVQILLAFLGNHAQRVRLDARDIERTDDPNAT